MLKINSLKKTNVISAIILIVVMSPYVYFLYEKYNELFAEYQVLEENYTQSQEDNLRIYVNEAMQQISHYKKNAEQKFNNNFKNIPNKIKLYIKTETLKWIKQVTQFHKNKHNDIFIINSNGEIIIHINPKFIGKNLVEIPELNKNNFAKKLIKSGLSEFDNFIKYKQSANENKLYYVNYYHKLDWLICANVNINNKIKNQEVLEIKISMQNQIILMIIVVFLFVVIFFIISYVFAIKINIELNIFNNLLNNSVIDNQLVERTIFKTSEIISLTNNTNIILKKYQDNEESLKRVMTNLETTLDDLVKTNQEKNDFLGIVAHDLKNPLSAIKGYAEEIEESYNEMSENEVIEYANLVKKTSVKMFVLITNLLDVNQIESGEINVELQNINILPILLNIVVDYTDRAAIKKINFQTKNLPNTTEKFNVYTDADLVRQILDNLISNAVKYSPQGNKDENMNIDIDLIKEEKYICFKIKNQGNSLTKDEQKKLFTKFSCLSTRPTGNEHSTGLGLFIVKKLANIIYGKVSCESELKNGCTFIVKLPNAQIINEKIV
jgi:signal transduction histidine kinase